MVEKTATLERRSRQGLVIAICSIIFELIGQIGGAISKNFQLGFIRTIMSDIPNIIGVTLTIIATIVATVTILCELYRRIKEKQKKNSVVFSNSTATFSTIILYILIWWLLTNP